MTLILKGTDNSVSDPAVQGGTGGATTGVYYPAANQVALATNGTLAFLVDASQNIGLGITPSAADSAYGQKVMQFGPVGSIASISASSTNNQTQISSNLTNPLGASPKYINSDAASALKLANGGFYFYSAAAGTAGAGAGFTTTLTMGLASQTIALQGASPASGIGITFPATQTASSNANTLDDYEEGTWVVTLTASSSGTITLNTANNEMSYIKVGSQVTIFGRVLINSVSSPSGSIQINLPFAPETGLADQSDFYALSIMTHDVDLSAGALTVFGESSGSNYIVVYQMIDNAAWTPLPASNLKGNGNEYFYITGSYRAA